MSYGALYIHIGHIDNMKLSSILYETSVEYYGMPRSSGLRSMGLNHELAKMDLEQIRKRGIDMIYYKPNLYADVAAAGTSQPYNIDGFAGYSLGGDRGEKLLVIDLNDRRVLFVNSSSRDTTLFEQLENVVEAFPEFLDYRVDEYTSVRDIV